MSFAAQILATTSHGGTVTGPGEATVLINGLPACVSGDIHLCAIYVHAINSVVMGSTTVKIGGKSPLRLGDSTACGAMIVTGSSNVKIGG